MEAIFPKGADAILQLTLSSISEASVTSADKNARTADRENNAKYGVIEAKLGELHMVVVHEGLRKMNGQLVKERGEKTVKFLPLALQMLLGGKEGRHD